MLALCNLCIHAINMQNFHKKRKKNWVTVKDGMQKHRMEYGMECGTERGTEVPRSYKIIPVSSNFWIATLKQHCGSEVRPAMRHTNANSMRGARACQTSVQAAAQ